MKLKNKKELLNFINNSDSYIDYLIKKLKEYGICGDSFQDFCNRIDEIEHYYENEFFQNSHNDQEQLRLAFWAFFSKLLIEKLGGELQIAPKHDYCEGTPQLINYGNRYKKNGQKIWIGIGFDSWLETHVQKKNLVSLKGKVENLIQKYS